MSLSFRWLVAAVVVCSATISGVAALQVTQAQDRVVGAGHSSVVRDADAPVQFQQGTLNQFRFPLVLSTKASQTPGCIPNATGVVTITRAAHNDVMQVVVRGLPPNTEFDLFVLQLPDSPFGVAWYQSDLETGPAGAGTVTVVGVFNKETFSISQGGPSTGTATGAATAVTSTNVVFQPTSQYHLGLWFNSPNDAAAAGCPNTVTPFNGEQNAGNQALSTRNFPAGLGPLAAIRP
jgi:hypothetical protein